MMSANLRAFLFLIRWAEGTSDDNGYRALYGHLRHKPKLFDDFSDHPRQVFQTPWGRTSAAGAYQFMARVNGQVQTDTWDRAKDALGLPDFSPESQDKAAVWLIEKRGALPAVERGDLDDALARCSWEWASLPADRNNNGRYGQPTRTFDSCLVIFERAGGTLMQPARDEPPVPPRVSPPPEPAPAAPVTTEPTMPLPISVAVGLATELWKILRPTQKVAEIAGVIEKAAPALLESAKAAVPTAVNEQQAVEQIKANPQLQAQFRSQALMKWDDLAPIWEAEEKSRREAREFGEQLMTTGPQWRQIGAGVLVGALSLTIIVGGGAMFWSLMSSPQLDPGQKGLILGALLSVFSSTAAYWFGSSASSRIKDTTIADQAAKR